jgi:hypothetical protein
MTSNKRSMPDCPPAQPRGSGDDHGPAQCVLCAFTEAIDPEQSCIIPALCVLA